MHFLILNSTTAKLGIPWKSDPDNPSPRFPKGEVLDPSHFELCQCRDFGRCPEWHRRTRQPSRSFWNVSLPTQALNSLHVANRSDFHVFRSLCAYYSEMFPLCLSLSLSLSGISIATIITQKAAPALTSPPLEPDPPFRPKALC